MSKKLPSNMPNQEEPKFGWQPRPQAVGESLDYATNYIDPNLEEKKGGKVFYLLLLGLVLFVVWASVFEIDQAVRAQGAVIPSSRTQIVQSADGGVLESLLVREGDQVFKGQRLAILEEERVNASFEEVRAKVMALRLALIRAKAEGAGQEPDYSNIDAEFSDLVKTQMRLYSQRRQSLQDAIETVESMLVLSEEEYKMNSDLFATGDISRLDVMRSERDVNDLRGQLTKVNNEHRERARNEAADLENTLASEEFKLEQRQNILDHTTILAPVDGVVKSLAINTVGGVLRAGDELMHISPSDGDVVVEVKVKPMDISQLELGMDVNTKLDSFDFSIYGSLEGKLTYISSDTITENAGSQVLTYYRAHISLQKGTEKIPLQDVKQGMTATVDIKTGRRTVMEFIVKPIIRGFSGALIQR